MSGINGKVNDESLIAEQSRVVDEFEGVTGESSIADYIETINFGGLVDEARNKLDDLQMKSEKYFTEHQQLTVLYLERTKLAIGSLKRKFKHEIEVKDDRIRCLESELVEAQKLLARTQSENKKLEGNLQLLQATWEKRRRSIIPLLELPHSTSNANITKDDSISQARKTSRDRHTLWASSPGANQDPSTLPQKARTYGRTSDLEYSFSKVTSFNPALEDRETRKQFNLTIGTTQPSQEARSSMAALSDSEGDLYDLPFSSAARPRTTNTTDDMGRGMRKKQKTMKYAEALATGELPELQE